MLAPTPAMQTVVEDAAVVEGVVVAEAVVVVVEALPLEAATIVVNLDISPSIVHAAPAPATHSSQGLLPLLPPPYPHRRPITIRSRTRGRTRTRRTTMRT